MSANSTKFYIDGRWVKPAVSNPYDVINPATEETAGQISLGSSADVDQAVAAARRAFPAYSATSRRQRLGLLRRIIKGFEARSGDLHLVLGPGPGGKPVRFRVTVDGAAPGDSHGTDVDADGQGIVTGQRLYQLIRQSGKIADHTFEIRFLDPGVQAYAFTFG
jgi:hypothetical protein